MEHHTTLIIVLVIFFGLLMVFTCPPLNENELWSPADIFKFAFGILMAMIGLAWGGFRLIFG